MGVCLDAVVSYSYALLMRSTMGPRVREAPRQRCWSTAFDISLHDTQPLRAGTEKPSPCSDEASRVEGATRDEQLQALTGGNLRPITSTRCACAAIAAPRRLSAEVGSRPERSRLHSACARSTTR